MMSDEALYERLLQGDISGFDLLYARYERHLFGFILRHVGDREEAEDILHEAFMAVLRDREGGGSVRSFRAWLFQVARNLCLNRLRSRRRAAKAVQSVADAPSEPAMHPEHALQERQSAAALESAVSRLPTPLAELYQLRAGGMSYDELAEVLAIPVGTVKSRMHQMVTLLREEMSR